MGTRGPIASADSTTRHAPMAVELAGTVGHPIPPADLPTRQAEQWSAYFASPVAAALDTVDLPALERLFKLYAALDTIDPANDKDDAEHFAKLARLVAPLETALGVTPAARARLGIKLAELKRTAAPLDLGP